MWELIFIIPIVILILFIIFVILALGMGGGPSVPTYETVFDVSSPNSIISITTAVPGARIRVLSATYNGCELSEYFRQFKTSFHVAWHDVDKRTPCANVDKKLTIRYQIYNS